MKYCVIKGTVTIIDGPENTNEIMLLNAENAGFNESEVEILTEEQFRLRKASEPKLTQPPTAEERLSAIEELLITLI